MENHYTTANKPLSIAEAIHRQFEKQALRANLRERITNRSVSAQQAANQAARLNRLTELMDKNPDICDIIDLMQGLDLL